MDFKIDENLPIEAAQALQAAGHGAATIHDQGLVGNPDPHIATVCQSEGRALVTLDLDFSEIRTYPPGDYPGIIVLRPHTQAKPKVINLVARVIPLRATEPLAGALWIVQENGIRIRQG